MAIHRFATPLYRLLTSRAAVIVLKGLFTYFTATILSGVVLESTTANRTSTNWNRSSKAWRC